MLTGLSQIGHLLLEREALQLLQTFPEHFGHSQNGPIGGEQVLAIFAMQVYFTAMFLSLPNAIPCRHAAGASR